MPWRPLGWEGGVRVFKYSPGELCMCAFWGVCGGGIFSPGV